jgi:hypothetical protein
MEACARAEGTANINPVPRTIAQRAIKRIIRIAKLQRLADPRAVFIGGGQIP